MWLAVSSRASLTLLVGSVALRGRVAVLALWVMGLLASALACGGGDGSPWLFCTTNPCRPLALFALPTPAALTTDLALAATCDYSGPGAGDGILLWHTDWDPRTETGRCASSEEAAMLGGK